MLYLHPSGTLEQRRPSHQSLKERQRQNDRPNETRHSQGYDISARCQSKAGDKVKIEYKTW
jgi:hypothetical protein